MKKGMAWVAGLMLMLVGLSQAQSVGSYIGKVENSEAFIAVILSSDQKVMAYVCDSKNLAQWFTGKLENGSFKITLPSGRTLEGKLGSGDVSGSLTLEDSKSYAFKAIPTSGEAGLYRYAGDIQGSRYVGGWIINQEGQQRGSVIGGGGLFPSFIVAKTFKSDFPALENVLAWLVTPDWVAQNLTL